MIEARHKNFHTLKILKPNEKQIYILKTWRPKRDIWITGASIGLLCTKNDEFEIYLAVSKSKELLPKKYFIGLKKDWLFYQQRDVYTHSTGIDELVSYHFLPSGQGFLVKKGEPIYIKVGAVNLTTKKLAYDAFCNIYYTHVKPV